MLAQGVEQSDTGFELESMLLAVNAQCDWHGSGWRRCSGRRRRGFDLRVGERVEKRRCRENAGRTETTQEGSTGEAFLFIFRSFVVGMQGNTSGRID